MKITLKQESLITGTVSIANVPFGTPVYNPKNKMFIMRVKPTGFLLNSNIVSDVLGRGDCFVANLKAGTVFATEGNTQVFPINSELIWSEA